MKLEYEVRIQPLAESDAGGYLAVVPELPGCMSDGETPEEALRNVQEAIESWTMVANAEKLRALKDELEKGMADLRTGHIKEWDFERVLRETGLSKSDEQ